MVSITEVNKRASQPTKNKAEAYDSGSDSLWRIISLNTGQGNERNEKKKSVWQSAMSCLNLNNILEFLNKWLVTWESTLWSAQVSKFACSPEDLAFGAGIAEKEQL